MALVMVLVLKLVLKLVLMMVVVMMMLLLLLLLLLLLMMRRRRGFDIKDVVVKIRSTLLLLRCKCGEGAGSRELGVFLLRFEDLENGRRTGQDGLHGGLAAGEGKRERAVEVRERAGEHGSALIERLGELVVSVEHSAELNAGRGLAGRERAEKRG